MLNLKPVFVYKEKVSQVPMWIFSLQKWQFHLKQWIANKFPWFKKLKLSKLQIIIHV